MNEILFETDWLGSEPVYYNELTGLASRNINDVIDLQDMELDDEGLAAYLDHGFSVFQRTLVKNVRFLPPSSRLLLGNGGRLVVDRLPDELGSKLERRCTEADIIELVRARVRDVERSSQGEMVIPTSGGYDSRLLNLMIEDDSRVRTFSYGTSEPQSCSTEVARARALSHLLGTRWERLPIGLFHMYFDDWDRVFGPAVHAHGMYHMEFYEQVLSRVEGGNVVLSGLFGDWFSGKGDFLLKPVQGPGQVRQLIEDHGMHADSSMSYVASSGDLYTEYYETQRDLISSRSRRLIEMVRFRMMLLHYLKRVPEHFGFQPVAPLIDVDVATAMLSLPAERRIDRRWLEEYFTACGVGLQDVEGRSLNTLNYQALRLVPLRPLDEALMREVVRPDYVRWINRNAGRRGLWWEGYARLLRRRGIRRAAPRLRSWGLRPRRLDAYCAYLVLKPIERLLRRRNEAREKAA